MKKSSKLPALQFYPGDWKKDLGIQSLDYESRGVWFELLLLMHDSPRRGYLQVNGKPMTDEILGKLLRIHGNKWKKIRRKLEDTGVVSIEEKTGILFCRRMVRDEQFRQIRIKGGELGGEYGHLGADFGKLGGRPKTPLPPPLDTGGAYPPPSSSSSSSLDILSKDNIYISPAESEPLKIEVLKPKKPPEPKPWPPEGEERRPFVFLTQAQCIKIYQHMEPDEFDYWLDELSDYAQLRPAYWKKTYKDHALVILKWRKMKLEKGFVWNPTEKGYRYPKLNKDQTQNLDWKKEWYEEQRQRIANESKG